MNHIYICQLKDAEQYAKILFVRVDANGEILPDYLNYGWTKVSLSEFLGISTNFSNQRYLQSSCSSIRFIAVYPNKSLDDDMDIKQEALLSFESNKQLNCPQIVCMFNYTSYINTENGQNELQKLYYIDPFELGVGQQGSVHKVQERKTGKWFAMKTIKIENEDEDRCKIQNEILLMRKICSPNIIFIKEHFMTDEKAFIIMELGHKDLQTYINERKKAQSPLSEQEFVDIALQICQAVKATHDCGIMHRDLKPLNLVFCGNNTLKLIDFGFARECVKGSSVLGTPQYTAPEIIKQEKYTKVVDIYSMGCIFYLLLTFKEAFISDVDSLNKNPFSFSNTIYPNYICNLCSIMLSKKPEIRPEIEQIIKILTNKQNSSECNINQLKIQSKTVTDIPIQKTKIENYHSLPIKDKEEFNQLIQKSQQTSKQLQTMIDNLIKKAADQNKNMPTDKQINVNIFKQICDNIILNHQQQCNNIDAIKSDIQYLFDNYSVVTLADGIHYGDNTTSKQLQFQKHVAKYPDRDLKVYDSNGQCIFNYVDDDVFVSPFVCGQKSGIAQYTRINGEQCTCACNGDKKFGFGQYKWANGEVYEGDFALDVRTGRGKYQQANGSIYEGDWKDNRRTGKGYFKSSIGDIYEGAYVDDKRTGKGILKFANKNIYEGDFVDDKMTGKGAYKFTSGDIYEGEWKDGGMTGMGILKFANGETYEGDFVDGKMTGYGVYKFTSGDIYEGDWKDDKRTGKGVLKFANLNNYEGDWKDDKRTGKGILKFANKNIYEGDFVDDKMTGKGAYKFTSGDIYEGEWKDGGMTGKGILKFANGETYEGDFVDGKMTGYGVYKFTSGDIYEGDWKDDKRTGKGVLKFANDDIYTGNWKDDYYNGQGKLVKKNGEIQQGIWNNGSLVKKECKGM